MANGEEEKKKKKKKKNPFLKKNVNDADVWKTHIFRCFLDTDA